MEDPVRSDPSKPTTDDGSTQAVLDALNEFIAGLNGHDVHAWADTIHFPHLRVHEGALTVWQTREEYVERSRQELADLLGSGWSHSSLDSWSIVHQSRTNAHVAVRFGRFDATGDRLSTFDSLYILKRADHRWGVLARIGFEVQLVS
ncbi:SnoaL-like protein [Frankia sp. AgKG'84/4]